MSALVIDLNNVEDQRDVVHRAVETLADGKLVVFPTETVYGIAASALHEEAVQRLCSRKDAVTSIPSLWRFAAPTMRSTTCPACRRWPSGWRGDAGPVRSLWCWMTTIPTASCGSYPRRCSTSSVRAGRLACVYRLIR